MPSQADIIITGIGPEGEAVLMHTPKSRATVSPPEGTFSLCLALRSTLLKADELRALLHGVIRQRDQARARVVELEKLMASQWGGGTNV